MPAIVSTTRITWDPDGIAMVLLDFGDEMSDDIQVGPEQGSARFAALGSKYGTPYATGGAINQLSWTRRKEHDDRAAALLYSRIYPHRLPFMAAAKPLRMEEVTGETMDFVECILISAPTRPCFPAGHHTTTTYNAISGPMFPVSGIAVEPGFVLGWYAVPTGSIDEFTCGEL